MWTFLFFSSVTDQLPHPLLGNRCGLLAFAQLPLIVGLASKNQVISYLTGISYEKVRPSLAFSIRPPVADKRDLPRTQLNFLHRAAGRACLLLSWIHTIERGMILTLSEKKCDRSYPFPLVKTIFLTLLPPFFLQCHLPDPHGCELSPSHTSSTRHWLTEPFLNSTQMGCVALISVTLLIGLSIKPFLRRVAYEVFLVSHIVFAFLFLLGSWMHWDEFGGFFFTALLP